jgi:hypothetical protein
MKLFSIEALWVIEARFSRILQIGTLVRLFSFCFSIHEECSCAQNFLSSFLVLFSHKLFTLIRMAEGIDDFQNFDQV